MPHSPRRRRPRHYLFAGIPHRQFDLRTNRTQLERFAPDLAGNVQRSARYGADRRVELRMRTALYGYSAEQGGHGGYADGRFAREYRGALAVSLPAVAVHHLPRSSAVARAALRSSSASLRSSMERDRTMPPTQSAAMASAFARRVSALPFAACSNE